MFLYILNIKFTAVKGVYLKISPWSVIPIAETILDKNLRQEGYSINTNPYVTILPSVESKEQFDLPSFNAPQKIETNGIKVHPSIEDPKVVYLDVSEDMIIQLWRDELRMQVSSDNMVDEFDVMKVNLLERNDDNGVSVDSRTQILEAVDKIKPPSYITAIDLEIGVPEYINN